MRSVLLLLAFFVFPFALSAQDAAVDFRFNDNGQRLVPLETEIDFEGPSVTLKFLDAAAHAASDDPQDLFVFRRAVNGEGADWELIEQDLPPGTASITDLGVSLGDVFEYQVTRGGTYQFPTASACGTTESFEAIGYAIGAVLFDQTNYRGQMILLVAQNIADAMPDRLATLKRDLTGDGWFVNELIVPAGAADWDSGNAVVTVKNQIVEIFNNAPEDDKPKVLFIVGHVPMPRSGSGTDIPPDGHYENTGARGADGFYADIDGVFTDTATFTLSTVNGVKSTLEQDNCANLAVNVINSAPLTLNSPGDFKFDQNYFPSDLEMAFGRINFRDTPQVQSDGEIFLTRRYLDRLTRYKNVAPGSAMGNRTAYRFGFPNSTDGSLRTLPAISGASKIVRQVNFPGTQNDDVVNDPTNWVKQRGPFMVYMQNIGEPDFNLWRTNGMNATVFSSDQSFWGYGDAPRIGSIRELLALDTKCLVILYTSTALNLFHQVGYGEAVGVAMKQIMNHNTTNQKFEKPLQDWDREEWWNRTHFAFHGDPTLRLHQVPPPTGLTMALIPDPNTEQDSAVLKWSPSPDSRVVGYHVYRSATEFGKYEKLTVIGPVVETTFTISNHTPGDFYMVRAVLVETTGAGAFLNPSQGIFVNNVSIVPPVPPVVPAKRAQTISFSSPGNRSFTTSPIFLTQKSNVGLPIIYTVANAKISGHVLTLVNPGTITVTARQPGNSQFNPAASVTRSFFVTDKVPPKLAGLKKSVSTKAKTTELKGSAKDNHRMVSVRFRVKPPGGKFSARKTIAVNSTVGASKNFKLKIPTSKKGLHTVEIEALDFSKNVSKKFTVKITKK